MRYSDLNINPVDFNHDLAFNPNAGLDFNLSLTLSLILIMVLIIVRFGLDSDPNSNPGHYLDPVLIQPWF